MHGDRQGAGALTTFVHLTGRERRVVIDPIELILQIAKRVMLKFIGELTGAAIDAHRFVHVQTGPSR
jgi:hypothetical protein